MARRSGRHGRRVELAPMGRRWIRINPEKQRKRQQFMPPRIQHLIRGWIYNR